MRTLFPTMLIICVVLTLTACAQNNKKNTVIPKPLSEKELSKLSQATFAAGCFWHEEAMFESIKGVKEVVSGYAGGTTRNPTYETIETGQTGHTETVNVYYDSSVVSYPTLVKVYFTGQNPTQVNGQGPDHGTQYRSVLFYRNAVEKQTAEAYVKTLQSSGKFKDPIAAQLVPFSKFWKAEDYHQDFIAKNPGQGYVNMVSIPEIKKLQKELPQYIKPDHLF
jgi:peptide-methionine (S)-S-oxide reductase